MTPIFESDIEQFVIELFQKEGFSYLAPEEQEAERKDLSEVVLKEHLKKAIDELNPAIPDEAKEQALKQVLNLPSQNLIDNNEVFHKMLTDGIEVEYFVPSPQPSPSGRGGKEGKGIADYRDIRGDKVWLIDWQDIANNEFLACNQFTVETTALTFDSSPSGRGYTGTKRPDVVLFVNGLPLVVIELKNPADENATVAKAFTQLQNYKNAIPSLFFYNGILIASDGLDAKAGTISSDIGRFAAWKSVDGVREDKATIPQIETLIKGMLRKDILLDLVKQFVVFEESQRTDNKTGLSSVVTIKKLAAYHQYFAVNKAVQATMSAMNLLPSPQPSPNGRGNEKGEGHYRGGLYFAGLIDEARELRKRQTKAEEIFWELVKNRKFLNLKFRRQHQIGPYIADFYCDEHKLIIEVDGGIHDTEEQSKKDKTRSSYLISSGFNVLRFKNNEIIENIESVLTKIESQVSPSTLGRGNKGEGNAEGRIGIVWHTQGSGKSLSMVFYTGKIVLALDNPTIVVVTDRNDLDGQLFDTFAGCRQLLRQEPVQAQSIPHLKKLLKTAGGGIVFTTIQKFTPEEGQTVYDLLSDRKNIVVIADEAHRSHYGFKSKNIEDKNGGIRTTYGFAKYLRDALPNASFIGFTATPIEKEDASTPAVFGNYIDVYDIEQSIADEATVKIYYESRLAKVHLKPEEAEKLDEEVEAITEGEESTASEKAKAKWTQLEAIVGHSERVKIIAADIVDHFEKRQEVFDGKAMIVAISRRVAVELYEQIIKLRPHWHDTDKRKGTIKVVMTSNSSDPESWQPHSTTKDIRKEIAERFKDPDDRLKIVIVCDMWLTGFDVPCLHTMYVDKPMRGHTLMQAIARVNRIFRDKPGGLIVDYIGIASDLKTALAVYTLSGGKGTPTLDQEQAVALMLEKYEVVCQMFDKFDYKRFFKADTQQKLTIILETQEYILSLDDGKNRFTREVLNLSKAFAISVPHPKAMEIKDDVGFFQAIKARLVKFEPTGTGKSDAEIETAIRQIVDKAVVTEGIIDVFDAAGIKKPDISILSDEFLKEIQGMERKNLALELLKKLLNDEIKFRTKKNLIQSKKFSEMLENAIKRYQLNLLTTAQIIDELIKLAKDIRDSDKRGEHFNLNDEELAFYDALANNQSAKEVLGDEKLRDLSRVLVQRVKSNTSIDWTIKESVRAKLKIVVKRLLRQYGYPPDLELLATENVLKQAELLADDWVIENT